MSSLQPVEHCMRPGLANAARESLQRSFDMFAFGPAMDYDIVLPSMICGIGKFRSPTANVSVAIKRVDHGSEVRKQMR